MWKECAKLFKQRTSGMNIFGDECGHNTIILTTSCRRHNRLIYLRQILQIYCSKMAGGYNLPRLYHSEGTSLHVHPRVNSFWWRQVSVRGHLAFLSPTLFCLHDLLRLFTPRLATTWRHASVASLS